ncbi:hypothetical protein MSAR_21090 [Mycolicibacterium sarraceniae]|uniref:Uncharacterized protein n=1 Tax=Mycolicibacterium sarraceniae TaxID=1534348 RepID=A0A7I7SQE2_9MYCO|nr:hypothetical protein MSAR_21090 [Mycolicibacterium sarraceniae]
MLGIDAVEVHRDRLIVVRDVADFGRRTLTGCHDLTVPDADTLMTFRHASDS